MSIIKENLDQFKHTRAGAGVAAAVASLAVGESFFTDGKRDGGARASAKRIGITITSHKGSISGIEGFLITRVS